ncbi:hypothetical protein CWI42_100310 [Ordospora colligata]|uniref:Uncharacterized protein n=1 Tax=Ordospora colligata OC4 TaxID=1354746 RepID=A0A0B2UJ15_9MICR|nr:uncharacterized protein M896_100310 [Ordospora colligata OC4]KHN69047.1 hypothetical protein M896_100310 [Ordospora colligata OC4]TBU14328.1 hypothetical protein CWI40_100320 [Ordospora colligata]TBU14393.1 hypothetical protein CWI41_100320 [Ordospora colligata]TBU17954.1 hypothetical protein CWI42_100310 [Ordospora colligata]
MQILTDEESDIEVLELQGDVENMDAFDGHFNKDLVQLEFPTFILQGRKIHKELSILQRDVVNSIPCIKLVRKLKTVYLFDKPPRYRRSIPNGKKQIRD